MALFRVCSTLLVLLLGLLLPTAAQIISPSNETSDIPPYSTSPRFWVNGNGFTAFRILPLGWYASIPQSNFIQFEVDAPMVYINVSTAKTATGSSIDFVSCDPDDYPPLGGPFAAADIRGASDILQQIARSTDNTVILFSRTSNHCNAVNMRSIATNGGIFTTLDPVSAADVLTSLQAGSGNRTKITPDRASYTTNPGSGGQATQQGGGTAIAMIILYTITGIITALFVCIIATGAIRAHRHPERYGPRSVAGGTRRSRAKGIARAMLDTLPIVKFGEKEPPKTVDIEMAPPIQTDNTTKDRSATVVEDVPVKDESKETTTAATNSNADGTDEKGQLGCSICTEDFNKGEEVRLLPCNHKFHPICVDPWLLNVSGTCPLCRIDLRPKEEQEASEQTAQIDPASRPFHRNSILNFQIAPPLGYVPSRVDRDRAGSSSNNRRDTTSLANLRSVALGSREERIAALRQLRQQRRAQEAEQPELEEERRGLTSRLRDRFRIRTRRQGDEEGESSSTAQRRSSVVEAPRATWQT